MSKYLIEVYLPAAEKNFELHVPRDVRLADWLPVAAELLAKSSNGRFVSDETVVLCDGETGQVYNLNQTSRELGFQNGIRVLMI